MDDWKASYRTLLERLLAPLLLLIANRHKMKTAVANHIEIGRSQLAQGNNFDAVFRFRLACWMDGRNAEAAGLLARAYLAKGNRKKADAAARRARELDSANADAAAVIQALQQP